MKTINIIYSMMAFSSALFDIGIPIGVFFGFIFLNFAYQENERDIDKY